jgi:hypothetical protein
MRLSEAAGLHINDIILDEDIPYINLTPHPWRSLKTKGSQRQIPLVGASLWAAQRIKNNPITPLPSLDTTPPHPPMLTQHQQLSTNGLSQECQRGVSYTPLDTRCETG